MLSKDWVGFPVTDREALLSQARKTFGWWHRCRMGGISARLSSDAGQRWRLRWCDCWRRPQRATARKTAGMTRESLKISQALFTFLDVEDREPTNNADERALRPLVLWRREAGE
jgi:transposase